MELFGSAQDAEELLNIVGQWENFTNLNIGEAMPVNKQDIIDSLRATAMHMQHTAREMSTLGGRAAMKAVEMHGASEMAMEWAQAIEDLSLIHI